MNKRQLLICAIIAVIAVSLIGYITFFAKGNQRQYDIVIIGDSILGNEQGDTAVSNFIEQNTGKTTFNGALGGTCATVKEDNTNESHLIATLSLKNVTDAIVSGDFGQLNSCANYGTKYIGFHNAILYYFSGRIKTMQQIDYSKVETIIISYGTNDFMQGGRIFNETVQLDVKTLEGSLSYTIETLRETYPELEIILTTPPKLVMQVSDEKVDGDSIKYGDYYLIDYVNTIIAVGEKYNVKVANLYEELSITTENVEEFLYDGIHPNETGRKEIAKCITERLLEN